MRALDVLIPHYNDPDGLALSLKSISRQTWPGPIRVVVVDDGSTAENRAAVQEAAEGFPHIARPDFSRKIDLIFNEENRGRPFTRNALLDAIDSPFVAWLDAGDEWYPKKLELQFGRLEEEPSDKQGDRWITCNYHWAWNGGKKKKLNQRTDQDQKRALLMGNNLRAYLWTLLGTAESFRKVGQFDDRLPRMQDLDFFLRFVRGGGSILKPHTDDALCVYHKSDIGRNADEVRKCNALIYRKHEALYERYGKQFCQMRLYNMEMLAARFAQSNDDHAKARRYMWSAFKHRPIAFLKHVTKRGLVA